MQIRSEGHRVSASQPERSTSYHMELIKQISGQTDVPLSISGEIEPLRILLKVVLPLALPKAANASQGTRAVPLPVLPLALIRQSESGVMHGAQAVLTTILMLYRRPRSSATWS